MDSRFRNDKLIIKDDFRREIKCLKDSEKMPSLDQVLAAMVEARKEYTEAVIAARKHRTLLKRSRR